MNTTKIVQVNTRQQVNSDMNTEELKLNIPSGQQRQTVKGSALILGMNRTTFIRNYLQTGKISKSVDDQGKEYIDLSELIRVFGTEKVLNGVRDLVQNEQNGSEATGNSVQEQGHEHSNLALELKIENASLKAEIHGLKTLLEERHARIQEKESLLQKQQESLTRMQYLLEDKQKAGSPVATKPSGFLDKLKHLFS